MVVFVECVWLVEDWGYDEVNFNCGCLFDWVSSGFFGVCLMGMFDVVVWVVEVMRVVIWLLVIVKYCIGIDDFDSYEYLIGFVWIVVVVGCE